MYSKQHFCTHVFAVDSEEILAQAREVKVNATKKVKRLQELIDNAQAVRERELRDAEQAVTRAKKKLDDSKKLSSTRQQVRSAFGVGTLGYCVRSIACVRCKCVLSVRLTVNLTSSVLVARMYRRCDWRLLS